MIIIIAQVWRSREDHTRVGFRILDVETGRTKMTSIKGIQDNIKIVENARMSINGEISLRDGNIDELPAFDSKGNFIQGLKVIVAYKKDYRYICTSANARVAAFTDAELANWLMKYEGINVALNSEGAIVPKYGVPFIDLTVKQRPQEDYNKPDYEDHSKDNGNTSSSSSSASTSNSAAPNARFMPPPITDVSIMDAKANRVDDATQGFQPKNIRNREHYPMTAENVARLKAISEESVQTLNYQQKEAATTVGGNVRLIAGAGTGKTNTLTKRIAYIIGTGVDPDKILSVTFTNKAAAEMRGRASKLLNMEEKYLRLQTFHSLCNDILRQCIHVIGWKNNFSLGGAGAFREMLNDVMYNDPFLKTLESSEVTYVKKKILEMNKKIRQSEDTAYAEYLIDKPLPKLDDVKFILEYELARDEAIESDTWDYKKDDNSPLKNYVAHILAYQRRIAYLSFDDLIALTVLIFKRYPDVLAYYQNRFQYIQVDEFQDTSPLQFELVKMLSNKYKNLFVVGDPDQSIYAFRNAAPEILIGLDKHLNNLKDIVMDINYRSTEQILDVGNEVIRFSKNRIPKDLQPGTDKQKGELPKVIYDESSEKLVKKIVRNIQNCINDGVPLKEIAVLYRSKMAESLKGLTEELTLSHIKYKVYGNADMNKLKEFDFTISLLSALLNRDNPYSMMTAIKYVRGLRMTKKTKDAFKDSDDCIDTFKKLYNNHKFSVESYNSLDQINQFIDEVETLMSVDNDLRNLRYDAFSTLLETVFTKESEEVIDAIWSKWEEYKEEAYNSGNTFDLAYLVSQLALVDDSSDEGKDDCVQIMTIHKSKGLEFEVVFVLNVNTSSFPARNTDNPDEEARLAYVAYTRAKKQLYLTCNSNAGWWGTSGPSIFIAGLPTDIININQSTKLRWQSMKLDAIRSWNALQNN